MLRLHARRQKIVSKNPVSKVVWNISFPPPKYFWKKKSHERLYKAYKRTDKNNLCDLASDKAKSIKTSSPTVEFHFRVAAQNMLMYIFGRIAYIFNKGVDASKANLLKNALFKGGLPHQSSILSKFCFEDSLQILQNFKFTHTKFLLHVSTGILNRHCAWIAPPRCYSFNMILLCYF